MIRGILVLVLLVVGVATIALAIVAIPGATYIFGIVALVFTGLALLAYAAFLGYIITNGSVW